MTPTLLEACDDGRLFDFALYPRQRKLLAAFERGPRVHVVAAGRRGGKTTCCALLCLHACLFRPDLDALVRSGERHYSVAIATNLAQARLLVSAARSVVEASPLLGPLLEASTEDELRFRLPSGSPTALRAFPCSSRGARGWPISTLVMDEAAHFVAPEDAGGHQTAERVWEALVPATAQFGDAARIVVSSTPLGKHGLFADLYARAEAGELPGAMAHHATTAALNPTIGEGFLELERQREPESFRAEYEACFLDPGAAFLSSERVRAAALEPLELAPGEVVAPVCALDPAFSRDPFALAVVGRDPHPLRRGRLRLALVRSWAPPPGKGELDVAAVLEEVAAIARTYGCSQVVLDQYASPPIRQHLGRLGVAAIERTMTLPSKTAIYVSLKAKLYAGDLELRDHPGLLAELERIEVAYSAGTQSIRIPRVGGSHGDLAQACALAVAELARVPGEQGKLVVGGESITGRLDAEITGRREPREPLRPPSTAPRLDADGTVVEEAQRDV